MKSCPKCLGSYPTHFTVCPQDATLLRSVTELPAGAVIREKYQILSKLGEGGMGVVYKAQHLQFKEVCALKLVSSHLAQDPTLLQRFTAEALLMRKLDHPHALRVHDIDKTEEGDPFIVMEFVEGQDLATLLREGPLEPARAGRIVLQACEALGAAHRLGIIHRDIKPRNIMVSHAPDSSGAPGTGGSDYVKVLDFGIAKVKESSPLRGEASLTQTGMVVGTPAYMSPEQCKGLRGDKLDGRTDLYSLGIVLYEALTGRVPFSGDTPMQLILAHIQEAPPDPRTIRAELAPALAEIVLHALEKDPAKRFASAEEMRDALVAALQPSPPEPRPETAPLLGAGDELEIAHVLFLDIVGYSKLPMDKQTETLRALQAIVLATPEYRRALGRRELISLPTGDGMALGFLGGPEGPVQCAMQIARGLGDDPQIRLRMGVHSGPVYRMRDIKGNTNIAGGGINYAQRVMDCGDAGHILLSNAVAEVLNQHSTWAKYIHELGRAEVKHGVKLHLFNFYDEHIGNREIPQKLRDATLHTRAAEPQPSAVPSLPTPEPRPRPVSPAPPAASSPAVRPAWLYALLGVLSTMVLIFVALLFWPRQPSPATAPAPSAKAVRENAQDKLKYAWIPAGTFTMGCSAGDAECLDNEKPAHQVRITWGYWIGQTEAPVAAYIRFARDTKTPMPSAPSFNVGWADDSMPIVNVTWDEAQRQ